MRMAEIGKAKKKSKREKLIIGAEIRCQWKGGQVSYFHYEDATITEINNNDTFNIKYTRTSLDVNNVKIDSILLHSDHKKYF